MTSPTQRLNEIAGRVENYYQGLGCSAERADITWLLEEVRALRKGMEIIKSTAAGIGLNGVYELAKSALEGERR